MPDFCHRCGEELAPAGHPIPSFCPHCGAPQLALSEDRILTIAAAAVSGSEAPPTTGQLPPPHPHGIHWRIALQGSAAVAAVAAGLWLLSLRVPFLGVLCWFWILSGSLLVLESYRRRRPAARITASVGARIGLVVGLALNAALALVLSVAGLLARFVTHSMGPIDAQLTAVLQAQTAQAAATVPDPADVLHLFSTPEFRTGLVLAVLAFAAAALLLLCTVSGALAGVLGTRRPTTPTG